MTAQSYIYYEINGSNHTVFRLYTCIYIYISCFNRTYISSYIFYI